VKKDILTRMMMNGQKSFLARENIRKLAIFVLALVKLSGI